MEIRREFAKRAHLEDFADENDLVMVVHERPLAEPDARFYALFENSEVEDYPFLVGKYGDGRTEDEAIRNYAKEISGRALVIRAHWPDERRIAVPILHEAEGEA